MKDRLWASRHDQSAVRRARESTDTGLDFAGVADVDWAQLHSERWRYGLDGPPHTDAGRDGRIAKDRRARQARRDLLEHLQQFPANAVFEHGKAGGIAARPRQARDEASPYRIGDCREHNW